MSQIALETASLLPGVASVVPPFGKAWMVEDYQMPVSDVAVMAIVFVQHRLAAVEVDEDVVRC